MATEGVATQESDVDGEHQGAQSDSENLVAAGGVRKPHGFVNVMKQDDEKSQCKIQEVAMHVLDDKRKGPLAKVALARLAHGAGRRISPECLVIRSPVVITGDPESARSP